MWLHGRESSYMPDMARNRAFRIGRSRTGLGLFATAPIKKRAFIVEYKGRKLTTEQADKLEARGNRYLFEVNSRWTIDGTSRKNLGRYANHSCLPNAEVHTIRHKVIIRAIKNIRTGAEITYNTAAIISSMSSHGVAANATSAGRNEPMRARRHAPKAEEPISRRIGPMPTDSIWTFQIGSLVPDLDSCTATNDVHGL